jgi:hypothetical protein
MNERNYFILKKKSKVLTGSGLTKPEILTELSLYIFIKPNSA